MVEIGEGLRPAPSRGDRPSPTRLDRSAPLRGGEAHASEDRLPLPAAQRDGEAVGGHAPELQGTAMGTQDLNPSAARIDQPAHSERAASSRGELHDRGGCVAGQRTDSVHALSAGNGRSENLGKTVLIVEEDREVLQALKTQLAAAGFEVLTATCGRDALAHAARQRVDAIAMDVRLPDLGGLEVASVLSRDVRTAGIPIVFGTAWTMNGSLKQACETVGGRFFLSKPYDKFLLVQALIEICA